MSMHRADRAVSTTADEPDVFTAIAHPVRRQLLDLLAERDQTVKALAASFAMTRPAISQHLKVLLDAGIVIIREEGRLNYYHLQPEKLLEIQVWLAQYQQFWTEHLDQLEMLLNSDSVLSDSAVSKGGEHV